MNTKKKELGQYFTSKELARLLSYLSFSPKHQNIIDPMCGVGHMLHGYYELNKKVILNGIEIDPIAYSSLEQKNKNFTGINSHFLQGNAFDLNVLKKLKKPLFDLVITNPPYVRYQRFSKNTIPDLPLLNAKEIRQNLLDYCNIFPFEDKNDKLHFRNLIISYSGLSDLAVPSWILCAMLTKTGGTLAMIVPETWLNREYALVIEYLLLRWFKIKYVLEDANSSWFPEAQVKTTLLIAERIERKPSAFSWGTEYYYHSSISTNAQSKNSIVGNIYPNNNSPEFEFVNDLKKGKINSNEFLDIRKVKLSQKADNLKIKTSKLKWLSKLESINNFKAHQKKQKHIIPDILQTWLEDSPIKFHLLEDYNVSVGQGLRTGANRFFYVDVIEKIDIGTIISPNKIFAIEDIIIPSECLKKVLRKQEELPKEFQLKAKSITGGVLVFKNRILPEDYNHLKKKEKDLQSDFDVLPEETSKLIRLATIQNIGSLTDPKYIPKLSAVAPNVRKWKPQKPNILPRFWYMLPDFKERHLPDLFIPRINNKHPKTVLNSTPKVLIDANFSTLWLTDGTERIDTFAILAILNTTWVYCLMEMTATVMGGGALKLEASHLKNIPIPQLNAKELNLFSALGRKLAKAKNSDSILNEIDHHLIEIFFGKKSQKLKELRVILKQKLSQRLK